MKSKIFAISITLVMLATLAVGCVPNSLTINTSIPVETNGVEIPNPTDKADVDWRGAAEDLLSPMLSIFGIDWVGNENSDALVTFDFIEPDGALRVYYDRDGNVINEAEVPFLHGDSTLGWAYAERFSLYDFDSDGIPEILLRFVYPESNGGFSFLYTYSNGKYNLEWSTQTIFIEFYAEADENIVILERDYEDLRISRIVTNNGFIVERLADWGEFWGWDFNDKSPSLFDMLNEPLTAIEVIDELQQSVKESVQAKMANTSINDTEFNSNVAAVIEISNNGQRNISQSSSFRAAMNQTLILEIKSTIIGGSVNFFLFSPSNEEQRITIHDTKDTDEIITINLSDGIWAYNCTGFFESGNVTIIGMIQ